jgi:hypothetical protein
MILPIMEFYIGEDRFKVVYKSSINYQFADSWLENNNILEFEGKMNMEKKQASVKILVVGYGKSVEIPIIQPMTINWGEVESEDGSKFEAAVSVLMGGRRANYNPFRFPENAITFPNLQIKKVTKYTKSFGFDEKCTDLHIKAVCDQHDTKILKLTEWEFNVVIGSVEKIIQIDDNAKYISFPNLKEIKCEKYPFHIQPVQTYSFVVDPWEDEKIFKWLLKFEKNKVKTVKFLKPGNSSPKFLSLFKQNRELFGDMNVYLNGAKL